MSESWVKRVARWATGWREHTTPDDVRETKNDGAQAEALAAEFLQERGLRIVERNFRVRGGEIDLIAREGESIVFVEVRLRRSREFGGAAASVTAEKQRRIILAARHWLARQGSRAKRKNCRFDCLLFEKLDRANISWVRHAFTADGH